MTIHFMERDYKPMICNTTNAKAISHAVGSTKVEDWEKKKIALFRATITAFGQTTECIRVRDYAPKQDELYCEVCGELITDHDADGKTYYILVGNFVNHEPDAPDTDEYALAHHMVAITPTTIDFTAYKML